MPEHSIVDQVPRQLERAFALFQGGELEQAAAIYHEILTADARNFDALHLLGVIAGRRRDFSRAADWFEAALNVDPGHAGSHCNLGLALQELGQLPAALDRYERAIAIDPRFAAAHARRGNVLRQMSRSEAALESYDRAIAIKSDYVEALMLRGSLLSQLRQPEAALRSFDRVLELRSDHAAAHTGRGNILRQLNRFTEALAGHDRALAADPNFVQAHVNRANVLTDLARHAEALTGYDAALALREDMPEAHFGKALTLLRLGDFARGWREYEWRWQSRTTVALLDEPRNFAAPLWLGQAPLEGRTILLHGEQGLGDRIQFSRYAALLKHRGARVLLEVPKPLARLFTRLAGVDELYVAEGALPNFDFHCPLMSLPLAFATRLDSVPDSVPYLSCEPTLAASWRSRLGLRSRPRVGLAWSGNPQNSNDRNRSIPLSRLAAALPDGFDYFSLHREVPASDAQLLRASRSIRDLGDQQQDFSDAAALCDCMDVIISVDTSLAHLAGALGKPTWVLLSFNADWRWLVERADTPWYPTMRLYRQPLGGDWGTVLERVTADLVRVFGSPSRAA